SHTRQDGSYRIVLPKAGLYTLSIESAGLQKLVTSLSVEGAVTRDFTLNPFVSRGNGLTVRGARDIQTVSRQTMTVKQIKEVPASFGDSVTALASLPGVNRPGSFFGPLVIRGADPATNAYFVDDIPLFKPMHFGGIHSVISNDMMQSIDLYSSAYPSQFSNAQSAIIDINTIDEVKEFGGNADAGFISANALIKAPITRTTYADGKEKKDNRGYIIAAGRVGYLSLVIPPFYKYVLDKNVNFLPRYWDYQFKAKYNISSALSLSFLAFGNKDTIDITMKDSWLDPGDDPAMMNISYYQNDQSHSQGFYCTYRPGSRFSNTVMAYAVENKSDIWYAFPDSASEELHGLGITAKPYIFALKDKMRWEYWEKHSELRAGAEARYYLFRTGGKSLVQTSETVDINDPDSFASVELGETYKSTALYGYVENKFTAAGLIFVPGIHSEYFSKTRTATFDPRGTASYTFPTGTTLGVAGGYYSMFMQTNSEYFTYNPDIAGLDYLKPQRSIHRSASIEQKIREYTFKTEGFYNTFSDIIWGDNYTVGNETRHYRNEGELKTWGAECIAKISDEAEQGLFGWVSYTWNKAVYKTNQSAAISSWADTWLTADNDMTHMVKAVAGYTLKKYTLSSKFQYN
ncbi:MAG: TonB-dependent receptor plug domain-containing protein, partial [Spirochaetota bacterium]